MSAVRERLIYFLDQVPAVRDTGTAQQMLDAYAHELAEKQRQCARNRPMRDGRPMAKMLTDLIDPEVPGA